MSNTKNMFTSNETNWYANDRTFYVYLSAVIKKQVFCSLTLIWPIKMTQFYDMSTNAYLFITLFSANTRKSVLLVRPTLCSSRLTPTPRNRFSRWSSLYFKPLIIGVQHRPPISSSTTLQSSLADQVSCVFKTKTVQC